MSFFTQLCSMDKKYWISLAVLSVTVLISALLKKRATETEDIVVVHYDGEKLNFVLRQPRLNMVSYTSFLRRVCNAFSVMPDKASLKLNGVTLKDGSLSDQNVQNGSELELELPKLSPAMQQIEAYIDELQQDLVPKIEAFCQSSPASAQDVQDLHTRLSETLLARMIKLDAVNVEDDPEARLKRKEAIRLSQQYLSKLDSTKNQNK
ncbi:BAG family molecular chaperone regulator Bag102 [Schizosaccharomyces pombe]|uniref:BAG family molecular chaperone regulator 1B n=1 Tax=Schizosaccharomyces pombe (strain 972 / ATCC 24843) TaxID=284812 RepID=BAG1B_SCHPO|nr:putative BAG family molecular chaperone regulator Bag102 [Schizosaccharomyces pombe]O59739.1 RecName: Full=BAG family molecular chaperone regulator 1B; Short=BAG-1B [Schizosaccharomyces pombe 972h-]AAD16127.1 BAG-family molecular chaperone regulator-1B protein [Schizosaccharomyces pombe]CAA19169.1 BAG family molecular chaperone regulator Bag102 (predicted) [Schizosaccharomyces pombe]|eukprot:NP_595316.1 putative BAG family molecular chaperone regulator Bag102 [Schizosaccharomyces pombe]